MPPDTAGDLTSTRSIGLRLTSSLPKAWAGFLVLLLGASLAGCDATGDAVVSPDLDQQLPILEGERHVVVDGHEQVLEPVAWVRVSHSGVVAVAQAQSHRVRLFDTSGVAVASAGGEGAGPGEFRTVHTGGWMGDTLWVFDPGLGRVSFFGPGGEHERSVSQISGAGDASGEPGMELMGLRVRAAFHGDTLLASGLRPAESGADVDYEEEFAVRLHGGTIAQVVAPVPPRDESMVWARTDTGIFPVSLPFLASGHWNVSPDGRRIVIATTELEGPGEGTVHLDVMDARGDSLLSRELPFSPKPMDEARLDSLLRLAAEPLPVEGVKEALEEEARERVPEALSPVTAVIVGAEDRIWLRLDEPEGAAETWMLLDAEGIPSGRLVLEEGETLHAVDGDRLWLISLDEADVPSVIRFDIRAVD